MGMVAPEQRIASAYFVVCGNYGDVTRHASQRGVCRQTVYADAAWVNSRLADYESLRQRAQEQERELAQCRERLAGAVVIDKEMQADFAAVSQAIGVTLRQARQQLEFLLRGQDRGHVLSVAELGRHSRAAGQKAGAVLAVLDELARAKVREAAADEIYVKDPVLMVVEPESLCWLTGSLSQEASGAAWSEVFQVYPQLEQVTRDGGSGLIGGVTLVNQQRHAKGQQALVDQSDHFHALRHGGVGLRKAQAQAARLLAQAEDKDEQVANKARQGQSQQAAVTAARHAWARAEEAVDQWSTYEGLWQRSKEALQLFTTSGELNSRAQAEAVLAETLPRLPDPEFAKAKRHLQKADLLNYLDRVHAKVAALPYPEELKQAAVRHEGLRRRPEALRGQGRQAGALRGVLLMCTLVLSQSQEVGDQAVLAIREILRRAYRASSLVECLNSVLRMQQAGHRRMTQELLDLKRLVWNCHRFTSGRRRKTTPYERLGICLPKGLHWWDLLKLTPEQLRAKLSSEK
jgi:hypothetical protein